MINAARMRHQHGRCSGSRSTAPHGINATNGVRLCANGCRTLTETRAGRTLCRSRPNLRKRITKALCGDFVCGERAYLAQSRGVPARHGGVVRGNKKRREAQEKRKKVGLFQRFFHPSMSIFPRFPTFPTFMYHRVGKHRNPC